MDEKCILNPERDCTGVKRADEVAGDVKALDRKLSDFQQTVADTNSRFGARIGSLETKQEVREEQFKQFKERLSDLTQDIVAFQRENKDSLGEFRREHKESIEELRKDSKTILDALTPLKHKVEGLERLSEEVDEIKEKPAKRWEDMVKQIIGLVVAALVGVVIARLGL